MPIETPDSRERPAYYKHIKTKNMYYRKNKMMPSTIKTTTTYTSESLEKKIQRFMNNKEPIGEDTPLIYTERKDGVQAAYDIRTDKWEIAIDAMNAVAESHNTRRDQRMQENTYDTMSDDQKTEFHKKYPQSKIKPIAEPKG